MSNSNTKTSTISFISVLVGLILLFLLYYFGFIFYTILQTNLSQYFIYLNGIFALLIVLKRNKSWLKKISIRWLLRFQLILAGSYLIIFFALPSYKCGAFTKSSNTYSCDCIGIKKVRMWNFTYRCVGIRTKCYLGEKENEYYEAIGKRVVKNTGNEIPCEGSLEFFK